MKATPRRPGAREVIRNTRIIHRHDGTDRDFLSLFRGTRLENVTFLEEYPDVTEKAWYIARENVSVGEGVTVQGPRVKWANWSWGTIGPVPAD